MAKIIKITKVPKRYQRTGPLTAKDRLWVHEEGKEDAEYFNADILVKLGSLLADLGAAPATGDKVIIFDASSGDLALVDPTLVGKGVEPNTITNVEIAPLTITNAEVAANAGIDGSKINTFSQSYNSAADVSLGTGFTVCYQPSFQIPRAGHYFWTVHIDAQVVTIQNAVNYVDAYVLDFNNKQTGPLLVAAADTTRPTVVGTTNYYLSGSANGGSTSFSGLMNVASPGVKTLRVYAKKTNGAASAIGQLLNCFVTVQEIGQ